MEGERLDGRLISISVSEPRLEYKKRCLVLLLFHRAIFRDNLLRHGSLQHLCLCAIERRHCTVPRQGHGEAPQAHHLRMHQEGRLQIPG